MELTVTNRSVSYTHLDVYKRQMVQYPVHSCTDITGFGLMGHCYEMAQGSGCTIHIQSQQVPYHKEAYELAQMGFIPAGAYRNRQYAQEGVKEAVPILSLIHI